jgi:hypothetical protein
LIALGAIAISQYIITVGARSLRAIYIPPSTSLKQQPLIKTTQNIHTHHNTVYTDQNLLKQSGINAHDTFHRGQNIEIKTEKLKHPKVQCATRNARVE